MMPWKLLAFIITMSMVLVFIGFNLENRCDVSVAFHTFTNVPVVITILASFLLGLLMAFPLSFGRKSVKRASPIKRGYGVDKNSGRERDTGIDRGYLSGEQGPSFGATLPPPKKGRHKPAPPQDSFDQD
ncbi:MAG: hypothetical protein A3J97_16855 [Spirochaetes bacterium RIFOXYC1_FULL_54_7]|nr:MAG: hypothetical protein A3J97_16855 [Spirochaetes bacterium RIFOXYC1_FULL_54_7]